MRKLYLVAFVLSFESSACGVRAHTNCNKPTRKYKKKTSMISLLGTFISKHCWTHASCRSFPDNALSTVHCPASPRDLAHAIPPLHHHRPALPPTHKLHVRLAASQRGHSRTDPHHEIGAGGACDDTRDRMAARIARVRGVTRGGRSNIRQHWLDHWRLPRQ